MDPESPSAFHRFLSCRSRPPRWESHSPLLTNALASYDSNFGSVLGRLYGWNTWCGGRSDYRETFLSEHWVCAERAVRDRRSEHSGCGCGGDVAVDAISAPASGARSRRKAGSCPGPQGNRDCLSFSSGFCLLALRSSFWLSLVLYRRPFDGVCSNASIVLSGIALGGLSASLWLRYSPDAHRFTSPVAFLAGVLCVISYSAFRLVIANFTIYGIIKAFDILKVGVPLMLPVSFLSGVFFTFVGAALRGNLASETETAGVLTLANTAGAGVRGGCRGVCFASRPGNGEVLLSHRGSLRRIRRAAAPRRPSAVEDRLYGRGCVFLEHHTLSFRIDGKRFSSDPGQALSWDRRFRKNSGGSGRAYRDHHLLRDSPAGKASVLHNAHQCDFDVRDRL